MINKGRNQRGKDWTRESEAKLKQLAKENVPTGLIAYALGRTVPAVRSKASDLNVSLKPTNRSPYNRRRH